MSLSIEIVTVDCQDPKLLASFWADALGWEVGDTTWVVMADPEGNEFCVLSAKKR